VVRKKRKKAGFLLGRRISEELPSQPLFDGRRALKAGHVDVFLYYAKPAKVSTVELEGGAVAVLLNGKRRRSMLS